MSNERQRLTAVEDSTKNFEDAIFRLNNVILSLKLEVRKLEMRIYHMEKASFKEQGEAGEVKPSVAEEKSAEVPKPEVKPPPPLTQRPNAFFSTTPPPELKKPEPLAEPGEQQAQKPKLQPADRPKTAKTYR